jgi:RecJ-like exonuclease
VLHAIRGAPYLRGMVEIVYEEIVCPECGGDGCLDGDPCPDTPGLCDCLPCPVCGGSGAVREALFVEIGDEDLPLAA